MTNFRTKTFNLVKRRRGSALVTASVFVTVMGMMVGQVLLASNRQTRNTYRSRLYNTSLAAAATTVNSMTEQAYYVATTRPVQLGGDFSNLNSAILAIQPKNLPGYVTEKNGNKNLSFMKASGSNDGDWEVINDPKDDWNGFNITRWRYEAVAFVNEGDAATNTVDTNAQRLGFSGAGFKANVEVNYIPLYQYAIFYDNDLEIHNGPVMNVMGPVHSNRTLWVASGSGLNFHDRVSAAGGFRSYNDFRKAESGSLVPKVNGNNAYLEDGSAHNADVTIKNASGNATKMNNIDNWTADTNKNKMLDSLDKNWLANALSRYDGKLQDASMGIKPIKPPLPYVTKPNGDREQAQAGDLIQRASADDNASMRDAKMEYKADIVIEGDPSKAVWNNTTKEWSNITIKNRAGTTTYPNTTLVNGNYVSLVTPGTFFDNREQKTVNSFDVNMGAIAARGGALPIANGNGLIYASPNVNGNNLPAVRLTNAATMPTSAQNTMTVATDKPMYLSGDVNTASSRATLLLAADAITVLSKGVVDSDLKSGNVPVAKNSTITNAIFMLGQVSSKYDNNNSNDHWVDGQYRTSMSGGAHNVLRYLENWDGKTHEFNGSLICLFESRLAKSEFWRKLNGNKLNFYNPPNRKYNWDANLRTRMPPAGMPVLVQVKTYRLERINRSDAISKAI